MYDFLKGVYFWIERVLHSSFWGESLLVFSVEGVSGYEVLWALGVFLLAFFFLRIVLRLAQKRLDSMEGEKSLLADFYQLLISLTPYSRVVFPLFIASLQLPFVFWIRVFFLALFFLALIFELRKIIKFFVSFLIERGIQNQDNKTKKNLSSIINTLAQVVLWGLIILLFCDNIGIKISPLLASLGVGGLAIAFASKTIVEDFFSSFSLMGAGVFRIGDFVSVASQSGTVRKIWLRATTLLTVTGKEIIVPNRTIMSSVVENSGKIKKRKKRFSLIIHQETPIKKLKKIPVLIGKVVSAQERATFDWSLLKDLEKGNLEVLVSYVVDSNDWMLWARVHEQVLLGLLEAFEKEGISLAYPTQMFYMKK